MFGAKAEKVVVEKMGSIELKDLLHRQERLLRNEKLLLKLPDKGKKVKIFAEKLRKELEERGDVNKATDLLDQMEITPKDDSMLTKKDSQAKIETLTNIFFKDVPETKAPFKPYKTIHSEHIPPGLIDTLSTSGLTKELKEKSQDKITSHKNSFATVTPRKNDHEAQRIGFEESIRLQEEQQKALEVARAEQAAEKLAERLGLKMGEITIDSHIASSYREPDKMTSDDEDGDDDHVNADGDNESGEVTNTRVPENQEKLVKTDDNSEDVR